MQVDTLCNGPVSANTPPEDIATIYIPSSKPIIDGYDPTWTTGFFGAVSSLNTSGSGSTSSTLSDAPCDRPGGPGNVTITINKVGITGNSSKKTVEIDYTSDRPIKTIRLLQ